MIAPLYRAAMEVSLENAGIDRPRVLPNGRVREHPFVEWNEAGSEIVSDQPDVRPMTDSAFVVQAVIEADAMLTALAGHTMTRGKEVLDALHVGSGEVEVLENRLGEVGHKITPSDLRSVLMKARRMIGAD